MNEDNIIVPDDEPAVSREEFLMRFDEYPTIVLDHRPYFSIVIPCFNGGKTISYLLDSIVEQHMPTDLEVIIVDDCSSEPYIDKIVPFYDKLSIRMVRTPNNGGPGNARQLGADVAEGQWLCFADADDRFDPDALPQVKTALKDKDNELYVITNIYEVNPYNMETLRYFEAPHNWCHGKFYNTDALWHSGAIKFVPNLVTHEDIAVSTQVDCLLKSLNREPLYLDIYTYNWMTWNESITRSRYLDDRTFLESFFKDYLTSTGYVYINEYNAGKIDVNIALPSLIEVILFSYFYIQGFKFKREDWIRENEQYAKEFYITCKTLFNFKNHDLIAYLHNDNGALYNDVRSNAVIGVGTLIEPESLKDWINMIAPDN